MYVEESSVGFKRMNTLKFSVCCAKGKVNQQFRCIILLFNNLLSLTKNVSAVDQDLLSNRGGNYTFWINGQIHHQVPNLKEQDPMMLHRIINKRYDRFNVSFINVFINIFDCSDWTTNLGIYVSIVDHRLILLYSYNIV